MNEKTPAARKQPAVHAQILVVEENRLLLEQMRILLEGNGYRVLKAGCLMDALQLMQTIRPDLILSTVTLGDRSGYAFLETVRARPEWVTIPFIFLGSEGGATEDRTKEAAAGRHLGADDYLPRPVSTEELLASVRSRLVRNQQLLLAEIQQAYESSLILLANAIELRDTYIRGHVERVLHFSMAIAQPMGLPKSQLDAIQFGSILHDIGKIFTRECILGKPGPLNQQEWEEMRRHPLVGAELVEHVPYLRPAIPVIRHHHERWDGLGYPDGLAGTEIPLAARVVAIADSLDAMTTQRVYQQACSPEEAYERILEGEGTQYDPEVIQAFRTAWPLLRLQIIGPEKFAMAGEPSQICL